MATARPPRRESGPFRPEAGRSRSDVGAELAVAGGEGVFGHEDFRVDLDGHREAQPGIHAARVRADRSLEELADVGEIDDLVVAASGLLLAPPHDGGVQVDVLAPGELRVEPGTGRDQARDPTTREHRALVRAHRAVDQLEQRRLAGAVETHQTDGLALLDLEADVVDRREGVGEVLAAHHRDRHLLERLVVSQGEDLGGLVHQDRSVRRHQSRSGIFFSNLLNASCAIKSITALAASTPSPMSSRWSGIAVTAGCLGSSTVPTPNARWISSTPVAIGSDR